MTGITRRGFLGAAAGAAALHALPAWPAKWGNWGGGQSAEPQALLFPASEEELVAALRSAVPPVRAVGGSHSFSPVVPTPGTLISLEAMNGLVRHDPATHQATFRAGTRLAMATGLAAGIGQSFVNEPDINLQSLGGAISTATHGTGRTLQCMSAYVTRLRLVTAAGDILECSRERNAEVFEAARVAIGSLGILTEITFQNMPLYRLRETVEIIDLDEALERAERERDRHRHIEFHGFLAAGEAILKIHEITTDAPTPVETPWLDENWLLEFAGDTARRFPALNRWIQELVDLALWDTSRVGESWQIFPTTRAVRFNEMEYQVPADQGVECLREIQRALDDAGVQVFFPVEFRWVKGDDLWLSPFHGRNSASISVHQYYKQDYRPLFEVVEPVFRRYGGRPHWGKLHTLQAADFERLYPRWKDFLRVRAELDPQGRFLNAHMRDVFGVRA